MSANLPSTTTKPGRDASYNSKFSGSMSPSMGEDEATVSKSLTDLANLPLPVPVHNKKSAGWDDDGFDDWNFEDVDKKELSLLRFKKQRPFLRPRPISRYFQHQFRI